MYDTRWPRPGPATMMVGIVVGLVSGIALGLALPQAGAAGREEGNKPSAVERTTTTLPDDFWTVVLASPNDQAGVDRARESLDQLGVTGTYVITRDAYPKLGRRFAVCNGVFDDRDAAAAHEAELHAQGVGQSFVKHVTR